MDQFKLDMAAEAASTIAETALLKEGRAMAFSAVISEDGNKAKMEILSADGGRSTYFVESKAKLGNFGLTSLDASNKSIMTDSSGHLVLSSDLSVNTPYNALFSDSNKPGQEFNNSVKFADGNQVKDHGLITKVLADGSGQDERHFFSNGAGKPIGSSEVEKRHGQDVKYGSSFFDNPVPLNSKEFGISNFGPATRNRVSRLFGQDHQDLGSVRSSFVQHGNYLQVNIISRLPEKK